MDLQSKTDLSRPETWGETGPEAVELPEIAIERPAQPELGESEIMTNLGQGKEDCCPSKRLTETSALRAALAERRAFEANPEVYLRERLPRLDREIRSLTADLILNTSSGRYLLETSQFLLEAEGRRIRAVDEEYAKREEFKAWLLARYDELVKAGEVNKEVLRNLVEKRLVEPNHWLRLGIQLELILAEARLNTETEQGLGDEAPRAQFQVQDTWSAAVRELGYETGCQLIGWLAMPIQVLRAARSSIFELGLLRALKPQV